MSEDGFNIVFFERANGTIPIKEFLDGADVKMRAKILKEMELLRKNGTKLREPFTKHLDDGIFELRTQSGGDISRALYFFYVGRKIIFTNGFIKKTKRTPSAEINRAKKYRAEYIEREL